MASILIVDDDLSLREVLQIALEQKGYTTWTASNMAQVRAVLEKNSPDLMLLDLRLGSENGLDILEKIRSILPELTVIMVTAYADTKSAIKAIKLGAKDYISKPFELDEMLLIVERNLEAVRIREENRWLQSQIRGCYQQIIGISSKMQRVFDLMQKIAPTQINVLITGESGTGKELIARALHDQSPRKDKPFVAINCGGLPENLIESELFGYRKGAFTSADKNKKGLFEIANSGTIFLDEVAELQPGTQVKLLRCIQEKTFIPLGATEEVHTDVRILAATNRSLKEDVADGRFREDFFYRLSGVIIHLPPLRDRGTDVLLLSDYFLSRACAEQKKQITDFSSKAQKKLLSYSFPGNVRELENIVERAVALEQSNQIEPDSLIIYEYGAPKQDNPDGESVLCGQMDIDSYLLQQEQEILQMALQRTSGHKGKAAKLVGLNFRQFRYRLTKAGVESEIDDDES